jgi:hypothetical protein
MEYSKLISVTGMSGLYELVSSKSDGALVRSIEDKITKFASNRTHNFSHLESIEVYTTRENANLVEVFKAMQESNEPLPNEKDAKLVKEYFKKVFSNMDFDRVYDSDRKKMVKWFILLKANEVEFKLSAVQENEEEAIESK